MIANLGNIFDAHVADKVALVDRLGWGVPREVTYAALDAYVNACARALRASGLVPGDRVAIISGNRGTAKSKEEAFRKAGVAVAETTDEIVGLLKQ